MSTRKQSITPTGNQKIPEKTEANRMITRQMIYDSYHQ